MSELKEVIRVESLSKLYRLGEVGTGTISHDLNRMWAKIRGKEDPYAKVGVENIRDSKEVGEYVWALKDINFSVNEGEVLGIIGKNGAGKSTLLKILSRITSPTTGFIKAKGRIAALLEVGTGMNPELTARENIFLNGAILGMRKKEITAKFDEIVDFSGCALYVDTPIKRYSSGMRVRLGFAVAAFLEPEILVVDEVLAVGDAEFQRKCIGKMKDVSSAGRTILFVSHNMNSIQALCTRCIWMEAGKVREDGPTETIINNYLREYQINQTSITWDNETAPENEGLRLKKISLTNEKGEVFDLIKMTYDFFVEIEVENLNSESHINATLHFTSDREVVAFATSSNTAMKSTPLKKGIYILKCKIPGNMLNAAMYNLTLRLFHEELPQKATIRKDNILTFEIHPEIQSGLRGGYNNQAGIFAPKLDWEKKIL